MKITTRLLLIAALFVLVLPLMFTGNASAVVFNPDGLQLNPTTGLWELPTFGAAGIAGCYDGTTTIVTPSPGSRFACYNVPVASRTTQSACVATGTTPSGWDATAAIARWSACSKGGYSANTTNPLTDCVTNSGTVSAFSRCNRSLAPADCNSTSLPGFTWVSTGTSAATYACATTGMNATACAAYSATATSGATVVGSAAVSGATTTCTVYIADATACTTAGGTISSTNVDETRGYCGGNWVFKTGTTGDFGSSIRNNCTKCHNPIYMASAGTDFEDFDGELIHSVRDAGTVSQYMNASHKNASRKIPSGLTAGQGLANVYLDTDGVEKFGIFNFVPGGFSGAEANQIRRIDWVNGKIEDTTGGLKNLPTGVYTEWYWEFGYYGEDPERGVFNMEAGTNGKPLAKLQACFKCHATGYTMSNTKSTTKEPELSFPGISWDGTTTYTPGNRPGVVNFSGVLTDRVTNVKTTSTYGMWDQMGVVCARCHNSADGGHTGGGDGVANPSNGYAVNAVCGQCHIRAGSSDWAVTAGTGALAVRSAVGTGHPNWHETDFLNSPHARFTGTYGQVATSSLYNSQFGTALSPEGTAIGGGCIGCHNPHGSVREFFEELAIENDPHGTDESLGPLEGVERGCAECHIDARGSAPAITTFKHPTDPTKPTPWATPDPCATCHMPGGRHLFRITTDANYTTTAATAFPAKAETHPAGTWNEAVWVDLKSACQQCHNGHIDEIPYIATADLHNMAMGMHGGGSTPGAFTANFSWTNDATTSLKVNFTASGCPSGDTCTYRWDFGDGTITTASAANITTSRVYAVAGSYTAQVIIADTTAGTNAAIAKAVIATSLNVAPTANFSPSIVGYTVTFTDTSTDANNNITSVKVNWGQGPVDTQAAGSVFSNVYTSAGTFIIKMTVTDAEGAKSYKNVKVTVPIKYSVSGSVMRSNGTTPVVGASVRLKKGTQVVKITTTNAAGAYTLTNVAPDSYTATAVKSGLTFDSPAAVVTNANVTGINITANR